MKKLLALSMVLGLALSAAALAQDSSRAGQPSQSASKSVQGTITQVDNNAKSFVVKDDSGQQLTVFWTDATRVNGEIKEGAMVSLQATDQDGKTVATSVQVRTKKPY